MEEVTGLGERSQQVGTLAGRWNSTDTVISCKISYGDKGVPTTGNSFLDKENLIQTTRTLIVPVRMFTLQLIDKII